MWEMPTYIDVIDPASFCKAARNTLQFWLDVHTARDAWAENRLIDDVQYAFEQTPIISNDFFHFDWRAAAYRTLASEYSTDFEQCAHCGSIWEAYSFDCNCVEYDNEDDELCAESVPIDDLGTLTSYLQEFEYPLLDCILERALWSEGFDAYREALEPVTAGIEEEIKECLDAIAAAASNYDLIQAVLWATRVYHVTGNIMEDYGDYTGLDYRTIDDVRNNGLESLFDRDEIREFITEESKIGG